MDENDMHHLIGEVTTVGITQRGPLPGFAIGYLPDGTKVIVTNGDLFIGQTIKVTIIKSVQGPEQLTLFAEIQDITAPDELLDKYKTKDNLIRTEDLRTLKTDNRGAAFWLQGSIVYPIPEIWGLVEYLIQNPKLWQIASIKVLSSRSISYNRAPWYGVDFQKALGIVLKERFIKSIFYVPSPERHQTPGYLTDMLVHLKGYDQDCLELETWQGTGFSTEVFYVHALLSKDGRFFKHIDGAIIEFEQEDLKVLFEKGQKVKGPKQKHFRLDGDINALTAFEIIRNYLPIEVLTNEYFVSEV